METLIFDVAWRGTLEWLDVPEEDARQMRAEVLAHYREPARAYHTLKHALSVLQDVKRFAHWWGVEDYGAVQLAALLHDVIYDTHSRANEAQSAAFVVSWGQRLGITTETCRRAADIILATRDHAAADENDTRLVLDADMAVLAAPWTVYDAYRRAVRREYRWVTEADWAVGRGRVLAGFLEQDWSFQTPALHDRLEAAARRNIAYELSRLNQP